MTRRRFGLGLGGLVASLLILPGLQCNKTGDLIQSLRQILQAVEKALGLLSLLQGLLPDVVNMAAKYLLDVLDYVNKVANLLEDETQSAADKARQILSWATSLTVPKIPDQRVATIIAAVAGAVDHFLSYFGTSQAGAGAQARSVVNPPNLTFTDKEKKQLQDIPPNAMTDQRAVEDWQKRALASPHSRLRYQTPRVFDVRIIDRETYAASSGVSGSS